jgi:hypothetical protein
MYTIKSASNPKYSNSANTTIDLEVEFNEIEGVMLFTASATDMYQYTIDLFNNAIAGLYGEIQPYVAVSQPTIHGTQNA